jgi:hypothetical protein
MYHLLFDATNDYQQGNSWADYELRNNPLAHAPNVVQVRGLDRPGCNEARIDITLLYAVVGAGASINFTEQVALAGLGYYKIRVTDRWGNEATGNVDVTAVTTLININTSALDASKTWTVQVMVAGSNAGNECDCEWAYEFEIASIASNPTATPTSVHPQGTLLTQVDVSGTKTTVADGGTQALNGGAASVNDVVNARIYITNTVAGSIVNISAVVATGNGDFNYPNGAVGTVPVLVNDTGEIQEWVANIDTSTVGAKTMTVTITNDGTVTTHNFDLTVTVS